MIIKPVWKVLPTKNPLTKRMITHIQEWASRIKEEDSFQLALIPWLVLSLTTGYCGIEWLQDHDIDCNHDFIRYEHPVEFTKNLIYNKCRNDWLFYDSTGKVIPHPLNVDVTTIASNSNCFCFQKMQKWTTKLFTVNPFLIILNGAQHEQNWKF